MILPAEIVWFYALILLINLELSEVEAPKMPKIMPRVFKYVTLTSLVTYIDLINYNIFEIYQLKH